MNNSNLRKIPRKIQVFENIEEIIRQEIAITKHEEPFYIVNLAAVLNQHKNWLRKIPRVKPYYAVKCNSLPIMIETLAALGVNFDCASKGEIEAILSINVSPDRIIYANPCKTRSYIKYAKSVGVNLMTFDSTLELKKIKDLYPESRLLLRIKVDDSHSICKFNSKFGANLEDSFKLLQYAKNLNLNIIGISFHVGSGCESSEVFQTAIKNARIVFDSGLKLNFNMHILDIGGGFPGNSNVKVTFNEIAYVVSQALEKNFPINYVDNLQIIAEPGRYFAAPVFTLATQIIAKKIYFYNEEEIKNNMNIIKDNNFLKFNSNLNKINYLKEEKENNNIDEKRGVMYYLNDGVYGSFNCTIFDYIEVNPQPYYLNNDEKVCKLSKLNYMNSTLWGPTCDSLDIIRKNIFLPEMEIGDWIIFREMGAYTIAAASTFNGFKLPSIKYYLDNFSLNTLSNLICWPRIKKLILKDKKKKDFRLKNNGDNGDLIIEHESINLFANTGKWNKINNDPKLENKLGLIQVH